MVPVNGPDLKCSRTELIEPDRKSRKGTELGGRLGTGWDEGDQNLGSFLKSCLLSFLVRIFGLFSVLSEKPKVSTQCTENLKFRCTNKTGPVSLT